MGSAQPFRILLLERREETAQRLIRELATALDGIAHEIVTAQNAGEVGAFDLVLCASRELARAALVAVPIVTYRYTDQNQFLLLAAEGSACPLDNEPHEQEVDLLSFIVCLAKQPHTEDRLSMDVPPEHPADSRYHSFFANSLAGGFWSTPDGKILEANPATVRMYGYGSIEELKGVEAWQLYADPEDRWNLLERLRREGQVAGVEIKGKRKNGEPVYVLANFLLRTTEEGGTPVVEGTLLDITERYRLQQQLTQVQKMEAIGQLAGGIAHDFNNLLMIICSYADLLAESLAEDVKRAQAQEILNAGRRATELTRQLLAFGRKQVQARRVLDLEHLLADAAKLLPRLVGEDVHLDVRPSAQLWNVFADPTQLEQVLMNLASNARDAMPLGGRLTLEASNVTLGSDHPVMQSGDYVLLTVSDSGHGIPADLLPRIFEPFFTTKEMGKGTGLGLASVYAIVQQHSGYIWPTSQLGVGTRFDIFLPRAQAGKLCAEVTPHNDSRLRGNETILLVEDEEAVRDVVQQFLVRCGYKVLPAGDGPAAIELDQVHRGHIDMLITDIVLPQMSGCALAQYLKDSRPGIKVLFMSGHAEKVVLQHGHVDLVQGFLQKPFILADLALKVRTLLDQPRGTEQASGASA